MSKPVDLNTFRKKARKSKAQGKTLCKSGFHKWAFDENKQFDVKRGELISIQICTRCGAKRTHTTP